MILQQLKDSTKRRYHVRLQPENKDMEPIIVDNCSILGKVVGLFRFDIH